jgi:hypothetical protein
MKHWAFLHAALLLITPAMQGVPTIFPTRPGKPFIGRGVDSAPAGPRSKCHLRRQVEFRRPFVVVIRLVGQILVFGLTDPLFLASKTFEKAEEKFLFSGSGCI